MRAKLFWFSPLVVLDWLKDTSAIAPATPLPIDAEIQSAFIDHTYYPARLGFIITSEEYDVLSDNDPCPSGQILFTKVDR